MAPEEILEGIQDTKDSGGRMLYIVCRTIPEYMVGSIQ